LRRSALSFAPALIGLGVLLGVSIAAELRASVWSTLLLREEAPKSVAGFALTGVGAGPVVPCGFAIMAARESAAGPAVGLASTSLFSALSLPPALLMTGAIGPSAVAAGRVCRLRAGAGDDSRRGGGHRLHEPRAASAAQGVSVRLNGY
jgi:hypothetical protein